MDIKHIKTKCDFCNKTFKLKAKMIKEKNVTEEVKRLAFKCPKCGHVFIVGYKDKEINANIKTLNEIGNLIRDKEKWEPMELENLLNKSNVLKQRNLELNARYKALYGA